MLAGIAICVNLGHIGAMTEQVGKHQNFYGRRKSRPLRAARQQALDDLLPKITFDPGGFQAFAKAHDRLWLDIGFGNGELLHLWVMDNPNTGYIGCEPFINGVSFLLSLFEKDAMVPDNLRVWADVAEPLLAAIPDGSLDAVSLLNPDPWPKARHHKRRFVRPENLDAVARVLKPGGLFFTCTDHPELAEHMAVETVAHGAFAWDVEAATDWHKAPAFWAPTRYAIKDMARSNAMYFLSFRKK